MGHGPWVLAPEPWPTGSGRIFRADHAKGAVQAGDAAGREDLRQRDGPYGPAVVELAHDLLPVGGCSVDSGLSWPRWPISRVLQHEAWIVEPATDVGRHNLREPDTSDGVGGR